MTGKRQCHYCGVKGVPLTRDHIVPRARGGVDKSWNVVDSCEPCNFSKGKKLPTCTCDRCAKALARWAAGERGLTRAQARVCQPFIPSGLNPEEGVPPDLACFSPAMRDLLMRRRRTESR
jgi:hypothetical protein